MHPLEAYGYVLSAARECGFELNGWIREGKVLEVLNDIDGKPDFDMEVMLIDGFVVVPNCPAHKTSLDEGTKERAEKFANYLSEISGQKAVVDMSPKKGGA